MRVSKIMTAWGKHADLSSAIYTFISWKWHNSHPRRSEIQTSRASKCNQVKNVKTKMENQEYFSIWEILTTSSSKKKGPWMVLDLDNPLLPASEMLCPFLNYERTDYRMTLANISKVMGTMIRHKQIYFFSSMLWKTKCYSAGRTIICYKGNTSLSRIY